MAEETGEAVVLREPELSLGSNAFKLMAAVVFGVILVAIIRTDVVAWVVVAAVLGLVGFLLRDGIKAQLMWKKPLLEVAARGYPLGSTPMVVYKRASRRVVDVSQCSVKATLTCTESASYQQGTDRRTDTHVVYSQAIVANAAGTADGFEAEIELPITVHRGAPSFDLGDNEVAWALVVEAEGRGIPGGKDTFAIQVLPEMARRYQARVQDT